MQACAPELGHVQACVREGGITEIRIGQVRALEVGKGQVCVTEVRRIEVGMTQVCTRVKYPIIDHRRIWGFPVFQFFLELGPAVRHSLTLCFTCRPPIPITKSAFTLLRTRG